MGTLIGLRFRTFASLFIFLLIVLRALSSPDVDIKGGSLDQITYTYCGPELARSVHMYVCTNVSACLHTLPLPFKALTHCEIRRGTLYHFGA